MVEFAVTLSLFLVVVMAIFEFVLMIMTMSRANEATRDMARIVVVSTPLNDISTLIEGCEDGDSPDPPPQTWTLDDASGDGEDTADRMFARAETHIQNVERGDILVTYECAGGPAASLIVSVSLQGLEYDLVLPGLLGLNPAIGIPAFTTHRTAESLSTIDR